MKRNRKRHILFAAALMLCVFVSGCGCGKKEIDPAKEQVLKITITPQPTPTPEPEALNSDAVVSNGGITMLNGYLEDASITGKQVGTSAGAETVEEVVSEDAEAGEAAETESVDDASLEGETQEDGSEE